MIIVQLMFWFLVAILLYVYAGYPVLVYLIGLVLQRDVKKSDGTPSVTVITSAYNEAPFIEATIRNKFEQDYEREKLEYIVVSDASEDGTDDVVRRLQGRFDKLTFIRQDHRQGKTAAINRAVREAGGKILLFSDANSIYAGGAIRALVRNFADPEVGYVTGKMVYITETDSSVSEGCSAYMTYENRLREWETRIGSVVGVDGGIDAVRRKLYQDMEPSDLPDFVLPLEVVQKGFRVVYEPDAVLREKALHTRESEFRMRVRVALRTYHGLRKKANLLNIAKYGGFSLSLISHKILRYLTGIFQILLLIGNILLFSQGAVYRGTMGIQGIFYIFAFFGFIAERRGESGKMFYIPYYFCLLNSASALALVKFLRGSTRTTWDPRGG